MKVLSNDSCLQIWADYRSVKRIDYIAVETVEAVFVVNRIITEVCCLVCGGKRCVLNVCEIPSGCVFLIRFLRRP